MKVLSVLRDPCFSPGAEEKDKAIMMAVVGQLQLAGCTVTVTTERSLMDMASFGADVVLTMGRFPATLCRLSCVDARVINTPESVARCRRSTLQRVMAETGIPAPPREGTHGYWLKRGDAAGAMTAGDVVFAPDEEALHARIELFRLRGITDYVVSAHVVGSEVKFYGVRGTGFFRCFPTGAKPSSADEKPFCAGEKPSCVVDLQSAAERLAMAIGIDVYGGDAIVRDDGSFCIIDFNDWPSFSPCREEAAKAIVGKALSLMKAE